jgi:2-amino-4-hydroxy-6-hydroxymethyldihydropteridine diphosphokinase
MHRVILLIGGNEGDCYENINIAKGLIKERLGNVILESSLFESEPWGFMHPQNFINQVLELKCEYTPQQILGIGQLIEKELGRMAKTIAGYEGRTMDIDILFYDDIILDQTNLVIPHPKMHERRFTMLPLAEKWSDFIHPVLKIKMKQLLEECKDEGWVRRVMV